MTTLTPTRPVPPPATDPRTVTELLDRAAALRPAAPAVRDTAGGWTYAELDAASRSVERWLRGRGIGPGDRVLVRLGNVREQVALLFGILRAGAAMVPVNPAMKAYHLATVVPDCEPVLLVTTAADVPALDALTSAPVVDVDVLWSQLPVPGPPAAGPAPHDLALLIYTSGSTSAPKAVVSPHAPVVFATRSIAERLRYRADDVILCAIPLSFDYGLYQVFLSVHAGAELVLGRTDAPVGVLGTLHTYGITVAPVVPSLAEMIVRLAGRDRRPPPPVRLFTNTGAALGPVLIDGLRQAFPAAAVAPMYGTTECKRISVLEPDGDLERPGSVGRALPGTTVAVVDDDGTPLPAGTIGEIVVRGPHVMAGYWRSPELTAARFRRDAGSDVVTLHTGDYGRLDGDGHLYFSGRRDDLFKRRGVRMSAIEIEAAALDVPGVTGAAVLPPTGGRDLLLFHTGPATSADVLAGIGERLETAKVPATATPLDTLPLTPNGKIDKKRLAEPPTDQGGTP